MSSDSSSSIPTRIKWEAERLPSDDSNPSKLRISLTIPSRLMVLPPAIFMLSATLGFIRASRATSLRFLAENAHRPPRTVQGWYFYQKTKNYRVLLGGLKGAGREGMRGLAVGFAWVSVEHYWREILGGGHLLGSQWVREFGRNTDELAAGIATSGVVSAVYKLGWKTGARTVALGALIGGILQIMMGFRRALEQEVASKRDVNISSTQLSP